ncbi:MAG TPA: MBL fold metallo-hydrolase [Candidatus Kapabacteria bacterium]|nr:MBL fold metallo-hydrolase [Candidatus Kapabacteria bacterium]HPO63392.1 MBL fold metallo-hydrolase [Candidatus Kapabacteria bacterium]
MKNEILFDNGNHKWIVFGRDNEKKDVVIDTNEYLIVSNEEAVLLDPGGIEIFPQVLTEITQYVNTNNIKKIISSHQDPDISSSLAMWMDLCKDVEVFCSWIWTGFIAHFSMGTNLNLKPIPDEGMEIVIGKTNKLYLVPAHYCHSSGNFSTYDPIANILFSGDIGAALLPSNDSDFFVNDFEQHIKYMELFHKRWMPSNSALKQWVNYVRAINPGMIAPQHGTIFKGENVNKFLNWLENLDVGKWNMGDAANDINKAVWMKWKAK